MEVLVHSENPITVIVLCCAVLGGSTEETQFKMDIFNYREKMEGLQAKIRQRYTQMDEYKKTHTLSLCGCYYEICCWVDKSLN